MNADNTESAPYAVPGSAGRGLRALVVILACVAAASLAYLLRERERANLLSTDNQEMNASLAQMRAQLQAVTNKVNQIEAQHIAETKATQPTAWPAEPAEADRKQSSQRTSTRDDEGDREMLESDLESSREEFTGSIARNHDEVLALERRGERSYFEFSLSKSKGFQRVGPVRLSLRDADSARDVYSMEVLVGDNRITKNDLGRYEPAFFYAEDSHKPLELVVNYIGKDEVQGYLSAPKYKQAELASGTALPGSIRSATPASAPNTQTSAPRLAPGTSTGQAFQQRTPVSVP
jgi:hypothetical protein